MKNQDPTKPMDSAQFVAQLASFSSVEQAVKTNAKLDAMMSALALSQAEGFIGRTIISADGSRCRHGHVRAAWPRTAPWRCWTTAQSFCSAPASRLHEP